MTLGCGNCRLCCPEDRITMDYGINKLQDTKPLQASFQLPHESAWYKKVYGIGKKLLVHIQSSSLETWMILHHRRAVTLVRSHPEAGSDSQTSINCLTSSKSQYPWSWIVNLLDIHIFDIMFFKQLEFLEIVWGTVKQIRFLLCKSQPKFAGCDAATCQVRPGTQFELQANNK